MGKSNNLGVIYQVTRPSVYRKLADRIIKSNDTDEIAQLSIKLIILKTMDAEMHATAKQCLDKISDLQQVAIKQYIEDYRRDGGVE